MKIAVIFNKSSNSSGDHNEKIICNAFNELNIQCETYDIHSINLQKKIEELIECGSDVIGAAGGDGTVSSVAAILAGGKIPLAVLPCGTLNHFAKDIGMPLDLEKAIKVISTGNTRMLDIAEVNGRKFINNSSIGLYAHTVKTRDVLRKHRMSNKWAALFYAAAETFKKFPLYDVKINIKGASEKLSTSFVFVGNNKYKLELFNPGIRERLDEGVLTLYISHCKKRFCMVRLAILSLFNMLDQEKDFETEYVPEVIINTRKKNIVVSLDGEVEKLNAPLVYKIIPESLPVILPS